ncbi:hypothetical protein PG991_003548 [Apiospora marii]|uniref:Uncharacterized protein n=1 Tax=Apiospora marii TaxID=335849 RepID=A0ABR1S3R9_9PEZI
MEDAIGAYLRFRESDVSADSAPPLRLKIDANAKVSLTLPYDIDFTVTRSRDDDRRPGDPVLVRWSPLIDAFTSSGLVLLEHTADGGFARIPVDHSRNLKLPEEERIKVDSWTPNLAQLLPGDSVTLKGTLPEWYQRRLQAGKRYTLLWPGKEVTMWDWGTLQDHLNTELRATDQREPRLILPGGPQITFLAEAEAEPWPERERREAEVGFSRANLDERDWRLTRNRMSPPPIQASERCEGAPHLTMTLACDPTMEIGCELANVSVRVSYDGGLDAQAARPVTFHTYALDTMYTDREGFRFYRRRGDQDQWEHCDEDDGAQGFLLVDEDGDVTVNIAGHEHFRTLRPGEAYEETRLLSMPEDAQPGDEFRYRFKGATVDWWAWGDMDEHRATQVTLPSWIAGPVVEAAGDDDRAGRPRLTVPASNEVSFVVVAASDSPRS